MRRVLAAAARCYVLARARPCRDDSFRPDRPGGATRPRPRGGSRRPRDARPGALGRRARGLPPDIARALVAELARDGTWAAPPRSGRRGRAARDPRRAGGRRPGPGVDHGGRPLALHRGQAGERLGLPPRLRRPPVAAPCALAGVVLPPGSRAGDAAAGPLSWSGRGGLSVARGARLGIDRRPAGDVARSVASPPQPPVALSSRRALDPARPHADLRRRLQRGRNPRVPAADRLLG